jgi:hypothetical protein
MISGSAVTVFADDFWVMRDLVFAEHSMHKDVTQFSLMIYGSIVMLCSLLISRS